MAVQGMWAVYLDTPALWTEEWEELGEKPIDVPPSTVTAGCPFSLQVRMDWDEPDPVRERAGTVLAAAGCRLSTGERHWVVTAPVNALLKAAERLDEAAKTLGREPGRAGDVLRDVVHRATRRLPPMRAGNRTWTWDRTLVMGILNVTPDSFSDGGRFDDPERALAHAREMVAEGADILDIGAESTRPGHTPVSAEEELRRLLPVVRAVASDLDVPISVDTYKARVAEAAVREGADMINDIWGLKRDPEMAPCAARLGVPVILMHNRESPPERDVMGIMLRELQESIRLARRAGIRDEQIILDPGIGFGKTYEQNLRVMRRLRDVRALGYPVLLGTSRKSMIGRTLNLPVDRRVEGTAATVALGVSLGVDIVRVHDVPQMVRTVRMMDAMIGRGA
ncbi:MAG: dihydropteroate synthase [Kyrpidia sp.]|nr:dihydropteroate synthase [Kyrpidia sp.]